MRQIIKPNQKKSNSHSSGVGDLTTVRLFNSKTQLNILPREARMQKSPTPAIESDASLMAMFKYAMGYKLKHSTLLLFSHICKQLLEMPNGRMFQKRRTMGMAMTSDPNLQIGVKQVGRILARLRADGLLFSERNKNRCLPSDQEISNLGLVIYLVKVKRLTSLQAVHKVFMALKKCPYELQKNVPTQLNHSEFLPFLKFITKKPVSKKLFIDSANNKNAYAYTEPDKKFDNLPPTHPLFATIKSILSGRLTA